MRNRSFSSHQVGQSKPNHLVATLPDGKVESDQQYCRFRWWNKGGGSRTSNNHFTRDVLRADGTRACVGYGVDSLTAGLTPRLTQS